MKKQCDRNSIAEQSSLLKNYFAVTDGKLYIELALTLLCTGCAAPAALAPAPLKLTCASPTATPLHSATLRPTLLRTTLSSSLPGVHIVSSGCTVSSLHWYPPLSVSSLTLSNVHALLLLCLASMTFLPGCLPAQAVQQPRSDYPPACS